MLKPTFLDFFAGSGLVTEALKPFFSPLWANDICEKKAVVYRSNHPQDVFALGPIEEVKGQKIPATILSWASFPCQDLSLAGNMGGLNCARSGLFWQWLRVFDEMKKKPPVVVVENVVGLLSALSGAYYRDIHCALTERGYNVGAVVIDASPWVPQSRPRVFIIGAIKNIPLDSFSSPNPGWGHTSAVLKVAHGLKNWVWWAIPEPKISRCDIEDIIDFSVPCDPPERSEKNLSLIPPKHWAKLKSSVKTGKRAFPGYKRTRQGRQVLELRFDGLAGCLRTPEGGSSRQLLVLAGRPGYATRLLSIPETARLMGVRKTYKLPGTYNDAYKAMGDAVAVPVARHLAKKLLFPLAQEAIRIGFYS